MLPLLASEKAQTRRQSFEGKPKPGAKTNLKRIHSPSMAVSGIMIDNVQGNGPLFRTRLVVARHRCPLPCFIAVVVGVSQDPRRRVAARSMFRPEAFGNRGARRMRPGGAVERPAHPARRQSVCGTR